MKLYQETWRLSPRGFFLFVLIPIILTIATAWMALAGDWSGAGICAITVVVMLLSREAIFRFLSRNRKALR